MKISITMEYINKNNISLYEYSYSNFKSLFQPCGDQWFCHCNNLNVTVCKIFVSELKDRLDILDRNKEVLRLGQGIDDSRKKKVDYKRS